MSEPTAAAASTSGIAGLPIWAWLAAALSVVTMGGGLAMPYVMPEPDPAPMSEMTPRSSFAGESPMTSPETGPDTSPGTSPGTTGFLPGVEPGFDVPDLPGEEPAAEDPPADVEDVWSPAIFRLGFSFFVGFAIAYAVRTFVKFSLIALGMFFLMLFGLQYAGFITVEWGIIQERYEESQGWLASQFGSFKDFVTGELPSAGLFATGFVIGFRRKG